MFLFFLTRNELEKSTWNKPRVLFDPLKAQKKKSCKSFDLQDSVAEREGNV